jgi:hypothetical protein
MLGGGAAEACLSVAETMLSTVDREVVEAKAIDVVARAELAGESNFVFITSFAGLFLPWSGKL